jgi:DinB superfamily
MTENRFPEGSMPKQKTLTHAQRDIALREHLIALLTGGNAHADFEAAIKDLPAELRGKTPKGAEHSAWELVEHLRIAQWDILDFSRNPKYKAKEWPKEYWPETAAPPDDKAWAKSVRAFRKDLKAMCDLVADESTDLYALIPHGEGQTILREALLVADHNAYHVGQLILVRRLLGAWK